MDRSGKTSAEALFSTNCYTRLTNWSEKHLFYEPSGEKNSKRENKKERSYPRSEEITKPSAQDRK